MAAQVRWLIRVAAALAARPRLWPTALTQARRLARPGWWRSWPPLPLPDPDWLAFRLQTAYGDPAAVPDPADVLAWLDWCRAWARAAPERADRARAAPRAGGGAKQKSELRYPRQR